MYSASCLTKYWWRFNRASESGISLVELTLVAPVLILLVSGAISLGFGLQNLVVISDAAKHGARIAATQAGSRYAGGSELHYCGSDIKDNACSNYSASLPADAPLAMVAAKASCDYLETARNTANAWNISVHINHDITEDLASPAAVQLSTISVTITRSPDQPITSVLSQAAEPINRLVLNNEFAAQSTFALERDCR